MGKHPELKSKVITPDVLVNPHMASLEMTFYPTMVSLGGGASDPGWFPKSYSGDAFAAAEQVGRPANVPPPPTNPDAPAWSRNVWVIVARACVT